MVAQISVARLGEYHIYHNLLQTQKALNGVERPVFKLDYQV